MTIRYGKEKKNNNMICILNWLILLFTVCERLNVNPPWTVFDVRITRSCKSVTVLTTVKPSVKDILVKIGSFFIRIPTGTAPALIRAAKNITEIDISIS